MKINAAIVIILLLALAIASCQGGGSIEFDRYYSAGSLVYQNHCQNCHGAHGEGLQGLIPPLTDSVFLKKNNHLLPCLVKNGLKSKIIITNRDFDGQMPANDLAPIDLARVLTYVTNSFGNKSGAVTVEMVNGDLGKCE